MNDIEKLKKFDSDFPMTWRKYYLHKPSQTKWRMNSVLSIVEIKSVMDNTYLPIWIVKNSKDFIEIPKSEAFEALHITPTQA